MELKDLLTFMDVGEVKTIDEFKEKFNGKFSPKSELEEATKKLSEATGKITGGFTTHAKRIYGLTNEEVKDKKWEEVMELGTAKLKAETEELKKTAGQGNDEALKEALAKIEKANKTALEFKAANEALQSTLEKTTGEYEGKLKGLKAGNIWESAKNKVLPKLKSDMSPAEKLGYEASIRDFVLDFDEKDTPVVKDKEGNMIKNPNKAGAFLNPEEVLEHKALELNLIKKNTGNGGQQVNPNFFAGGQNQSQNNGADPMKNPQGRTIHPNALKG